MTMAYESSSLALEVKLTPVCSQLCHVLASDLAQTGSLSGPPSLYSVGKLGLALMTL